MRTLMYVDSLNFMCQSDMFFGANMFTNIFPSLPPTSVAVLISSICILLWKVRVIELLFFNRIELCFRWTMGCHTLQNIAAYVRRAELKYVLRLSWVSMKPRISITVVLKSERLRTMQLRNDMAGSRLHSTIMTKTVITCFVIYPGTSSKRFQGPSTYGLHETRW